MPVGAWSFVTYCDIKGGGVSTGNINSDPLFSDANFHLSAESPCIDAGDNSAVPTWLTEDYEGDDRIIDGGLPDTPVVDMGADESNATSGYIIRIPEDHPTIQDGIDNSEPGCTVLVAPVSILTRVFSPSAS